MVLITDSQGNVASYNTKTGYTTKLTPYTVTTASGEKVTRYSSGTTYTSPPSGYVSKDTMTGEQFLTVYSQPSVTPEPIVESKIVAQPRDVPNYVELGKEIIAKQTQPQSFNPPKTNPANFGTVTAPQRIPTTQESSVPSYAKPKPLISTQGEIQPAREQESKFSARFTSYSEQREYITQQEGGTDFYKLGAGSKILNPLILFGSGGLGFASGIVENPKTIVTGPVIFGYEVITKPKETGEAILERATKYPYTFLGEQGATLFFYGKALPEALKFSPVKATNVKIGDVKATTIGLENPLDKTQSYPLVSVVSREKFIRANTEYKVSRSPTGQFQQLGTELNPNELLLGKKQITARLRPSDLSKSTPQPTTSLGANVVDELLILSKKEKQRLSLITDITKTVEKEKGLPVEDFSLKIEELKNPTRAKQIIEKTVKENEGVIYGSLTTEALPKGYKNVKIGDVDIIFPSKTVEEITPILEKVSLELQQGGENVRLSSSNVIEFTDSGNKLLEAKSGINQNALGLDDEAPAGFRGIRFPDYKKGQTPKNTIPFGEARAITVGEQTARKGAGATIISEGSKGETPSFSQAGILGKQGNPRGLKDTAGFFQQTEGIAKIYEIVGETKKAKTLREKSQNLLETYTPEQQLDIKSKFSELTGNSLTETKVKISTNSEVINYPKYTKEITPIDLSKFSVKIGDTSYTQSIKSEVSQTFSDLSNSRAGLPPKSSTSPYRSPNIKIEYLPQSVISPRKEQPSSIISPVEPSSTSSVPSSTIKPSSTISYAPKKSSGGSSSGGSSKIISSSSISAPGSSSGGGSSSSTSPKFSRYSPPPSTYTPNITTPKLSPIKASKKPQEAFNLFVRERGEFRAKGTFQNVSEAFRKGVFITGQGASASFKILSQKGEAIQTGIRDIRYRPSKKNPTTYVQKSKYRISSLGEKAEISKKGQEALSLKRKKIGGLF